MNKTVVALVTLAMLVSPAIPTLGGSHDDGDRQAPSSQCPTDQEFGGQYWTLAMDPQLPGVVDVRLAEHDASLATQIRLPGEEVECRLDGGVRVSTDSAELRFRDRAELRMGLTTDDEARATIELAPNVTVQSAPEDDGYRLTPEGGPTLTLVGDNLTLQGSTVQVTEDAQLFRTEREDSQPTTGDDPSAQRDEQTSTSDPDEENASRSQAGESQPRDDRQRQAVTEGSYAFGAASLNLSDDTLEDVRWRNATLFETVEVPGLTPAEERQRGPQLRLEGDEARVRMAAAGGLMARMEAERGLEATVGEDVEIREDDERVFLSMDNLLVVVEGEDVSVRGPTITAEELRFHARSPQTNEDPVWRGQQPASAAELPYAFEGRHVGFQLQQEGLANLSVHGTPVGEVSFDPVRVEELRRTGAHFEAEGESLELRVEDTPAVQLRLEADNLTVDVAERTTLPSGAEVHVRAEEDELRLRVDRPADALANRTAVEHRPARGDLEPTEGAAPGLQARSQNGSLGVKSTSTSTIQASFDGAAEAVEGNVSVQLGLSRAMLIDDANGNGKVDVGEPARAERPLTNGTVSVEGDELVHRFPLWSGNLTVTVEPGEETAKVTYSVHNLSAPPGTLFVLENEVSAPADANLTPTDTGVIVENGTMSAEYSAAGPVTVDGEEAWAQRSIFVDDDDRVRVLLAYPSGDNITHDPTLAVQSSSTEVVQRLAASPYAILVGAGLAGVLVAGTVLHRRRKRP